MTQISPLKRGITFFERPAQNPVPAANHKLYNIVLPIVAGALLVVSGIFLLLAAAQVVPHGVNAISHWGIGGYVLGGGLLGMGAIITASSIVCYVRTRRGANRASRPLLKGPLLNMRKPEPIPRVSLENPRIEAAQSSTVAQPDETTPLLLPNCIDEHKFEQFLTYHSQSPNQACGVATGTTFFHYCCDEHADQGWGCAWRCMQMIASSLGLSPSFLDLYDGYRQTSLLSGEWAEPGYGKRYLDDVKIPCQLMLYNRREGTKDKTPTEWCDKIAGFPALRAALVEHFSRCSTPVMADDTAYTFNILGIRVLENGETILFIADPHKLDYDSGLYFVALNGDGRQIATTSVDDGINGMKTAQKVYFERKGWILLFPQPSEM